MSARLPNCDCSDKIIFQSLGTVQILNVHFPAFNEIFQTLDTLFSFWQNSADGNEIVARETFKSGVSPILFSSIHP